MKKQLFFYVLLVFVASICFNSSIYCSDGNATEEEIELRELVKSSPTKSLLLVPDIKAYKNDTFLNIDFNESIAYGVSITITGAKNGIVVLENINVNSPITYPVFFDMDEDDSYILEISGVYWTLSGKF